MRIAFAGRGSILILIMMIIIENKPNMLGFDDSVGLIPWFRYFKSVTEITRKM